MERSLLKMLEGYQTFRSKYAHGDQSVMQYLSDYGQQPDIMVVACCDSRVDPALILQCDPGDLFVVRNVANIVPPYEADEAHHGTSAALEFGICFLKVKHLILLGHSLCGGIQALIREQSSKKDLTTFSAEKKVGDDFISNWVSIIKTDNDHFDLSDADQVAKLALKQSYRNCLTFPWIAEKIKGNTLQIHLWFFDIKTGRIFTYSDITRTYEPLNGK